MPISSRPNGERLISGLDTVHNFLGLYLPGADVLKQSVGYIAMISPVAKVHLGTVLDPNYTVSFEPVKINEGDHAGSKAYLFLKSVSSPSSSPGRSR